MKITHRFVAICECNQGPINRWNSVVFFFIGSQLCNIAKNDSKISVSVFGITHKRYKIFIQKQIITHKNLCLEIASACILISVFTSWLAGIWNKGDFHLVFKGCVTYFKVYYQRCKIIARTFSKSWTIHPNKVIMTVTWPWLTSWDAFHFSTFLLSVTL